MGICQYNESAEIMAVSEREGLSEHTGFRGLRNNVTADGFELGDLVTALNVDIDDELRIKRRKGFSTALVAGVDRDLWASGATCLAVGSNALKQIRPDYSTVTLRSGLTAAQHLSYAAVGDRAYYANGVESGCVSSGVHRTWGLTVPGSLTVAAGAGTLLAGKYQVAVTYLRSDGQESGAGLATAIELTDIGGLSLSAIPVSTDATVTHKAVYATSVGGETLYRRGVITNATTTFEVQDTQRDASPLLTQFLSPPPAGQCVGYFSGWMLVASGSRLYPSESYAPELFDVRKAVPFTDRITMVAPVDDGVWIGTASQVVWLTGDSPETWQFYVRADYGVIPGALTYGDAELVGDGKGGSPLAFFATTRGLCIGDNSGGLTNATQERFAYPSMDRGAGVVRRHNGMAQYLATLEGSEVAGSVAS